MTAPVASSATGWFTFIREFCCASSRTRQHGDLKSAEPPGFRKEILRKEFNKYDTNGSGRIPVRNARAVLSRFNIRIPEVSIRLWLEETKTRVNGELSFKQFYAMYQRKHSVPDLKDEFYEAKYGDYVPLRKPPVDQLFLTPVQLQKFCLIASNGDDMRSESECIELIQKYAFASCLAKDEVETARKPQDSSSSGRMLHPRMSYHSFQLMLSDEKRNGIADPAQTRQVHQDMTQPLSHYFISSSHNSYLLGSQLTNGVASSDAIKAVLQLGVRVVELDVWDGPNGIPLVTHGKLACKATTFEECVQVLKKYAFESTQYPCIISIENHCSLEQQLSQARIMESVLGDSLYVANGRASKQWMSPNDLQRKFLLREKITKSFVRDYVPASNAADKIAEFSQKRTPTSPVSILDTPEAKRKDSMSPVLGIAEQAKYGVHEALLKVVYLREIPISTERRNGAVVFKDSGFLSSSSISGQRMAAWSSDNSLVKALTSYAKDHIVRVYPAGGLASSGNYDPVHAWNSGCQVVSLNYQTLRHNVWLSQGKFRINGGCGYVLKPRYMLENQNSDAESQAVGEGTNPVDDVLNHSKLYATVQSTEAVFERKQLVLNILSAHYVSELSGTPDEQDHPTVEVCFRGVASDAVVYRTGPIVNDRFDPPWQEDYTFTVLCTELSLLMFVVKTNKRIIGQYALPTEAVRTGYRVVPLYKEDCTCLENAYLFCRLRWEDL